MAEIDDLKAKIQKLERAIQNYEFDGPSKLYYSLNRKAIEMANLLNAHDLGKIDIEDKGSKSFERIIVSIKNATDVASAVKSLAEVAGITGDEDKDVRRRPLTPESMSNVLGNTAGTRN
jgi:hypothetical protein